MSSLITQQTRSLNDMLSSERSLRTSSEKTIRKLRQLLLDAAVRLDGERMEQARHNDPHAPDNWTVEQWHEFIKTIPAPASWGQVNAASSVGDDQRVKQLLAEVERLTHQHEATTQKLFEVEKERSRLASVFTSAVHAETIPSKVLEGSIAPWVFLLEESKKISKSLPKPCPVLQKTFVGGARIGGDLQKAFSRVFTILYLIGKHRLCSAMEIDALIGGATEASARSGSLRRVMDDMIEKELLLSQTLEMSSPKTSLKAVRLSPKGEQIYRELFNSEPEESDWARLIRLHEGAKYIEHTLAVLCFGIHARKRGYYTCVLPDVEGDAVPDIWIARGDDPSTGAGQGLYVEVELGSKDHEAKWKNLAALNNGRAAFCASSPRLRERYSGDCQLDGSGGIKSGVATDLEALVKYKYLDVDHSTPLWITEW